MNDDPRANRHYATANLPTLKEQAPVSPRQDILFKLYGEVCSAWRLLTDVRFKLLGFIPIVTGAALLGLLSSNPNGPSTTARIAIAFFGLLITLGLLVYEMRNSNLYDDLISRGRKIEEELGVDTGLFLGRRDPPHKLIKHDVAIRVIYGTACAGWLAALLIIGVGL